MTGITLECPECGGTIAGDDDRSARVTCPHCGTALDIEVEGAAAPPPVPRPPDVSRANRIGRLQTAIVLVCVAVFVGLAILIQGANVKRAQARRAPAGDDNPTAAAETRLAAFLALKIELRAAEPLAPGMVGKLADPLEELEPGAYVVLEVGAGDLVLDAVGENAHGDLVAIEEPVSVPADVGAYLRPVGVRLEV